MSSFGTRLRAAREMRGLTQGQLADQAEIPASSVSHFESDRRRPSFDNLRSLAVALDADLNWLLCLRSERDPEPSWRLRKLAERFDAMSQREQAIVLAAVRAAEDPRLDV